MRQAQYTELPEGAAARRSGRGSFLCGRRSTQSFLKELRRGLSPQWPRLPVVWQAQYTECPEGAAARIVAAVAAAALCVAGAVHRVLFVRQAQDTERPEGAAARIVAAVYLCCVAGAVHRVS